MAAQERSDLRNTPRLSPAAVFWFAVWAALLVMAGIYSPKLQSVMTRGAPLIAGSESAAYRDLTEAEFPNLSDNQLVLVFTSETLTADDPAYKALVDDVLEQVRQIAAVTGITTPWDGAGEMLIGADNRSVAVMLDISSADGSNVTTEVVPRLKSITRSAPEGLKVYLTGDAAANYDLFDEILDDVAVAERFVIPIILVVLLIIFGSVVAAALPLVLGLISVAVSLGLFYFYAGRYQVHDASTALISMMGMGVGVDYALFLVTRFREELAAGRDPVEASRSTMATAGKAILFSGATVVVSVLSLFIVRSEMVRSLGVAMALVVVVAVGAAETLLPPILQLLGHRVNALRLPLQASAPRVEQGWRRWAMGIMRRPALFIVVSAVPLLLLAAPAVRMSFGMPNISLLSNAAEARQGYEILEEQFSPGLLASVEVALTVPKGTVADAENLTKIYEVVDAIRQDPGVDSVVSYVSLDPTWTLEDYQKLYVDGPLKLADLANLNSQLSEGAAGLSQVSSVLDEVRSGLLTMQDNVSKLADGSGDLARGASEAKAGLTQIRSGLREAASQVETGADQYQQLVDGLNLAQTQLDRAIAGLDNMTRTTKLLEPNYRDVYEAVMTARMVLSGGTEGGPSLAESVRQGADGLKELAAGLYQIDSSLGQVEEALGEMASGAGASGDGQRQVAKALGEAASGLEVVTAELQKAGQQLSAAGQEMGDFDPLTFLSQSDLGLRMVDAAGGQMLGSLVNLDEGADVARVIVIPKYGPDDLETRDLIHRLRDRLHTEYAELNPQVGGYVAILADANDHMAWALPRVIGLSLAITFVVLLMLLHSVLLPLIAVILNAFSVCASYGVLVWIFQDGHLSGLLNFTPLYYLESPVVVVLFAVLFGLSMDYQVFLLSRVKETWDHTRNNEESVASGVAKTAGIITGAATIMVLVFVTFGVTGMLTIKEMAFGLAVAIFLDASLVRLVLAPALMRLTGTWNWWAPAWMLRVLPGLQIKH